MIVEGIEGLDGIEGVEGRGREDEKMRRWEDGKMGR